MAAIVLGLDYLLSSVIPAAGERWSTYALLHIGLVRAIEISLLLAYLRLRFGSLLPLGLTAAALGKGVKVAVYGCLILGAIAAACEVGMRLYGVGSFLAAVAAPKLDSLPAIFLVAVLLGPLFEELLFRVLFYASPRRHLGVPLSLAFSTLLFAGAHLPSGQIPWVQAVGGVFFCLSLEFSGSLLAPFLIHAAGNAVLFLLPHILG